MLLGLQTNKAWGDLDYQLIRPRLNQPPQFQSVLLYSIHGCKVQEPEIAYLKGVGIQHMVMRLQETIYEPDANHPSPWLRDPVGYAEDCLRVIARFVRVGVLDYVVGPNEANIYYQGTDMTPTRHAEYLQVFINHIRTRRMRDGYDLPQLVRLGLPPVAWIDEYPHMPWLMSQKGIARAFDFLPTHTYWQSSRTGRDSILAGPLTWERFGGNYRWYQAWMPGMPIMATEVGNSIHEKTDSHGVPVWTPAQVQAFRLEQYPIWNALAADAGVEACHYFISAGATIDWTGYKLNPQLASTMAQSPHSAPVPEAWRVRGGI